MSSSRSRMSKAARRTSSKSRPSSGSRSKTMRSGFSTWSMREPQMWNSSTFICTPATMPGEVVDVEIVRLLARRFGDRDVLHRLGKAAGVVLLEEAVAAGAGRAAHEAERPLRDVRQHQLGDRLVIVDEVALGDALVGIDHASRMGDADASLDDLRGVVGHRFLHRLGLFAASPPSPSCPRAGRGRRGGAECRRR